MFKFMKRNAVTISLTIGAVIAVGLGCAYFAPVQTAAVLLTVGGFFSKIGNTVAGWFGKGAANVADAGGVDVSVEPTPASAAV